MKRTFDRFLGDRPSADSFRVAEGGKREPQDPRRAGSDAPSHAAPVRVVVSRHLSGDGLRSAPLRPQIDWCISRWSEMVGSFWSSASSWSPHTRRSLSPKSESSRTLWRDARLTQASSAPTATSAHMLRSARTKRRSSLSTAHRSRGSGAPAQAGSPCQPSPNPESGADCGRRPRSLVARWGRWWGQERRRRRRQER